MNDHLTRGRALENGLDLKKNSDSTRLDPKLLRRKKQRKRDSILERMWTKKERATKVRGEKDSHEAFQEKRVAASNKPG